MGLIVGATKDPAPEVWEERFKFATNSTSEFNKAGYGPSNPYIPPLQNPQSMVGYLERHEELI